MRIFLVLLLAILSIAPASAEACWNAACVSNATVSADTCPLRSSGPLSKADVSEAADLLKNVDASRETLKQFRDVPDSSDSTIYFRVKRADGNCNYSNGYGECTLPLSLGAASDVRDIINGILKARIEKAICRLRAIGIDVPKP